MAPLEDGLNLGSPERSSPDSDIVDSAIPKAHRTIVGVGPQTILTNVDGQTRGGVDGIEVARDRVGAHRGAIEIGDGDTLKTIEDGGDVMPGPVVEGAAGSIIVAAAAATGVAVAQVPLKTTVARRGDHPPLIAATAPVLVTNQGRVTGPVGERSPKRNREADVLAELKIGRGTQRNVVEGRTVGDRGHRDRTTRTTLDKPGIARADTMIAAAGTIGGVVVEGQPRDE